jgi:hypothetical protein
VTPGEAAALVLAVADSRLEELDRTDVGVLAEPFGDLVLLTLLKGSRPRSRVGRGIAVTWLRDAREGPGWMILRYVDGALDSLDRLTRRSA